MRRSKFSWQPRFSAPWLQGACFTIFTLGLIALNGLNLFADPANSPAAAKLHAMGRGINILGYDGI